MRYRLIPTLGTNDASRWFETSNEIYLRNAAKDFSDELGKPVLVVHHPVDGAPLTLFIVGQDPNKTKRRVR